MTQTPNNLRIENETKFLKGNFEVEELLLRNASLTIVGNVDVQGGIQIENSTLIISEDIHCGLDFDLVGSQISARAIAVKQINAQDSEIFSDTFINYYDMDLIRTSIYSSGIYGNKIEIQGGNLETDILRCGDLVSDSDVIVHKFSAIKNCSCFSYLVDGDSTSRNIRAIQEICILGANNSWKLVAPTIFIGSNAYLNRHFVIVSRNFEVGGALRNCKNWRKDENRLLKVK